MKKTNSNGVSEKHKNVSFPKEDRPIMVLFTNLINNTGTSLTLTNAQIRLILEKEFNIDLTNLHVLGIDVYISLIKEYLKQWPGWKDFDHMSSRKDMRRTLEIKYENMRWFLREILDTAKPLVKKAISDVEQLEAPKNDKKDVVMEIWCTRDQINQLVNRTPESDLSTDIFNITERVQNRIILHEWDLESILKLQVQIYITMPCIVFTREMCHIKKHVLINRVHTKHAYKLESHDTSLMVKTRQRDKFSAKPIVELLEKLINFYRHLPDYGLYTTVLNLMRNELLDLPSVIPYNFMRTLNKYAYYRHLHSDNGIEEDKKYDLQIEETIIPRLIMKIDRVSAFDRKFMPSKDWLKLKCMYCCRFLQCDEETIVEHFNIYHQNEQDWFCTNCNTRFNVKQLVDNMWHHEC